MSDDRPVAETTEQDHTHVCPVCMDSWLHASDACGPVGGRPRVVWARCPIHEGESDE